MASKKRVDFIIPRKLKLSRNFFSFSIHLPWGKEGGQSLQMGPYSPEIKFNWAPLLTRSIPIHVGAIFAIFYYPPILDRGFLVTLFLLIWIPGIGISLGYHRCLTHQALEFKFKWIERLFVTLGSLTLQRGPLWWSSIHRIHHQNSDTPQDPHNSRKGFLYSHFLWLSHLDPRWEGFFPDFRKYQYKVEDLCADPYYRWLDRYWYFPWCFYLIILFILGGLRWVLWGGFFTVFVQYHLTWVINSVTHKYGYRSFKTKPDSDESTNNWFFGVFPLGEGWHNNHHAFPSSAKHGFFHWWEFDLVYAVIWVLHILGLISKVILPTSEAIEWKLLSGSVPSKKTV